MVYSLSLKVTTPISHMKLKTKTVTECKIVVCVYGPLSQPHH